MQHIPHPARLATRLAAVALVAPLALAACGDDDPAADHPAPGLQIGVVDYAFDDVPPTVEVGTPITITNHSTVELHELVAVHLPDGEQRNVAELVALPAAELGALIGSEPAMVQLAPPGAQGFAVVGDGTLDEPGRYLLICTIPTGADPDEYLAAAEHSAGPPQVAGGAPHFAAGMYAEIEVVP